MSAADWRTVSVAAALVGLVVALHGINSKRWQTLHTVGVVLGAAAAIAPRIGK
jgi:hypothetical protein